MKKTLFLLLKIIFLYFIILSNSFGQSHFNIGKFPKPINDCYEVIDYEKKGESYKKCDVIKYEYFYNYTPPLFIINDNISVNQSWSELQSNSKCIYIKKRKVSSFVAFECNIDSERFVRYRFYSYGESITFDSVEYLACSNNDVEKIRESLINKFKTENVIISDDSRSPRTLGYLNTKAKYILDLRDNTKPHSTIKLHAAIITGKDLNSNYLYNRPEKNLKCPGDVMLMIELKIGELKDVKSKLKEAIDKIDKEDELNKGSKTSTPKF